MPRRFSNPCFKFVRKADNDSSLTFVVVVVVVIVAAVVEQINATKAKKIFILIMAKTVSKIQTKSDFCCSVAMVARMQATAPAV